MTRRYRSAEISTLRGDTVTVTIVTPDIGPTTFLVSLDDIDDSVTPTAAFTLEEILVLSAMLSDALILTGHAQITPLTRRLSSFFP